jgi:hypothetical protein
LVIGYYIAIASIYILSQIELEAKGYGLKISIANLMNQLSCTLDATTILGYTSQGKALLLLMSIKNSKLPLGTSNTLRIVKNKLKMRKLWPPKVKGVKNFKKNPLNTTKASF